MPISRYAPAVLVWLVTAAVGMSSTGAEGAGYSTAAGNRGGAVKGQGGDVYAGHDGNAYRHTSDGWSKWSDGSWQSVTPPTGPQSAATRPQNSVSTISNGNRGLSAEHGSFQQLEQDRQARLAGLRQGSFGGARDRGGAGGFREGGGGHFRR